jgi:hypothetical protein
MLSWGPRQRIAGGVLTRLDRWSRYKASPRHWLGLVDEVQQRTAGPVPTGLGLVQTYARSFLASIHCVNRVLFGRVDAKGAL